MAHNSTLVQSGEELFVVAEDGGGVELSIPSTVTLTTERPPRFEISGVHAVMVNSTDTPLIVDDNGIVLFLSPPAPTAAPTLAVGASGDLTGVYQVKYTFAIRTLDEVIIAESGFSPSASITLTSDHLSVSALQTLSGLTAADYNDRYEVVRRIYRTTRGTDTYFLWYTVEDNTTTSFTDDATDASINTLAADALGTISFLSHIATFRERLYGVSDQVDREVLLYSEVGQKWAWPTDNIQRMPQVKGDAQSGITALLPRRDVLGITKSNMLIQWTGDDDFDFRSTILSTSVGCVSQESAAIYRDQWYFLGQDGVYRWGEQGIECISDGRVRSWFTTDIYFDREAFVDAVGVIDVIEKIYRLYLLGAGESTVTKWVEYDIASGTWWGPHTTTAYDFRSAFRLGSHSPLIGEGTSTGYITIDTDTRSDDGSDAIEVNATLAPIHITDPPTMTYFGTLNPEIEPQAAGTLEIYPTVGELDESEDAVFNFDMTLASIGLGRIGYGRYMFLRFYHNTINQLVHILGFEVDPVNVVGRRQ